MVDYFFRDRASLNFFAQTEHDKIYLLALILSSLEISGWLRHWSLLLVREVWVPFPGRPIGQTAATFPWRCIALVLSRRDRPRHSLHAWS